MIRVPLKVLLLTIRLSVNIDEFTYPDGTVALADICLDVARGEFTGILGSNGSGKTTLLKIMDGLIREYRGKVLLDGQDVLKLHARDIYRKVGLVFQNPDDQLFASTVFFSVKRRNSSGFDAASSAGRP